MITSSGNAKIRNLLQLRKKAKEREQQGLFLVEGIKMFEETPESLLHSVYASDSFARSAPGRRALDRCPLEAEIVSDDLFQTISDTKTPQGILALVRQLHYELEDLISEKPLILVLENLQDPGNLGTIMRTAEGAGVTGILLSRGCADIYNPKVTRSTMGSVFRVPFFYTDDLSSALDRLKLLGIRTYAAHLAAVMDYDEADYTGPAAFLIGNESRGLTGETADKADLRIRIPMCGEVESLNAAVASSILIYEAFRQRRRQGQ